MAVPDLKPDEVPQIGVAELSSPRKIVRARRKRALKQFWGQYWRSTQGRIGLIIVLVWIGIAVFAPVLASRDQLSSAYATAHHQPILMKPSWLLTEEDKQTLDEEQGNISEKNQVDYQSIGRFQYPLGTDEAGRSLWSLLIFGSRISLLIGLVASFMTIFIGATIGLTAGFLGGKTDTVLSRLIEAFLILPWIALAVVIASILSTGLLSIMAIIAITSWATTSQLVRAQSLSVKERTYVDRARALGASNLHVATRHVLPNVMPIIFADTTLTIAVSVAAEALLALLGLGDPNSVSWGSILDGAQSAGATLIGAWWYVMTPGICLTTLILGFSLCGFAIEEIVNPRLRRR